MSERITLYACVYDLDGREAVGGMHDTPDDAKRWGASGFKRISRFVELRDNDEITPKGKLAEIDEICGEMTDRALKAERELNAAIERAEKAEAERSMLDELLSLIAGDVGVKKSDDGWASTVRDVRIAITQIEHRRDDAESALNDAAAKYERETAAKLLVEVYCSNCADNGDYSDEVENATSVAALLRSHYFPPAKEVSNG